MRLVGLVEYVTSAMFVLVAIILIAGLLLLCGMVCSSSASPEAFQTEGEGDADGSEEGEGEEEEDAGEEVTVYTGSSIYHTLIEVRKGAASPLYGRLRLYLDGQLQRSGGAQHAEDMVHEAVLRLIATNAVETLRGGPEDKVDVPLRNVAIVGGGDGGALREVLKYPGIERVVVFELDERVLAACEAHMGVSRAEDDHRVRWVFGDATVTVRRTLLEPMQEVETFDLVVVDAEFGGAGSTGPKMRVDGADFIEDLRMLLRRDRGASILVVGVADTPGAVERCDDLLSRFFAHTWAYDDSGSSFVLASRSDLALAPTDRHHAAWRAQDVNTRHWEPT